MYMQRGEMNQIFENEGEDKHEELDVLRKVFDVYIQALCTALCSARHGKAQKLSTRYGRRRDDVTGTSLPSALLHASRCYKQQLYSPILRHCHDLASSSQHVASVYQPLYLVALQAIPVPCPCPQYINAGGVQ